MKHAPSLGHLLLSVCSVCLFCCLHIHVRFPPPSPPILARLTTTLPLSFPFPLTGAGLRRFPHARIDGGVGQPQQQSGGIQEGCGRHVLHQISVRRILQLQTHTPIHAHAHTCTHPCIHTPMRAHIHADIHPCIDTPKYSHPN